MSELEEGPEKTSLQERLKEVWKVSANWKEGKTVKVEGLAGDLRFIRIDPVVGLYALRIVAPNAPENEVRGKPNDIPIAIFGEDYSPREVRKAALRIGSAIRLGEVNVNPDIRPEVGKAA